MEKAILLIPSLDLTVQSKKGLKNITSNPRQAHKRASLYKSHKRTKNKKGPTRTKAIGTTLPNFLTWKRYLLCLPFLTERPALPLV